MKKRILSLIVLAFFVFIIFGTGGYAADPVVLKVAHVFKTDFSAHLGAAKFAELVEKKSNSSIIVKVFPNQQLGNERECLEGAKFGSHDIALTGAAGWAIINPKLGTFELPFLYRDMAHQQKVFSNAGMGMTVDDLFSEAGLRFLAYYGYGIRSTLTKSRPVRKLEDFEKLRIRVPEVPIFVKTFQALGANPTPVNYGETYTALQTDLVEGVEGSPEGMVSMKFTEICKYYTLTAHQSPPILMAINKKTFENKLSPEQQKIVMEAAAESSAWEFGIVDNANNKALESMKAQGIEVIEISDAEKKRIEEKTQIVYEELGKKYGGNDLIAKIKAIQ